MARSRKASVVSVRQEDDQDSGDRPSWYPSGGNPYGEPQNDEGEHNVAFWAWELARCHSYFVECQKVGLDFDYATKVKAIQNTVKEFGINLSSLGSNRTEHLIFDQPEEFFEVPEARLDSIEKQLKELAGASGSYAKMALGRAVYMDEGRIKKVERSLRIIHRLRKVRRMCREREPAITNILEYALHWRNERPEFLADLRRVFSWTHELRVMLYCRRSDVPGWDQIVDMPRHLTMGTLMIGEARESGVTQAMWMMPPGHGKTTWLVTCAALEIRRNPNLNHVVIHHKSDEASKRLVQIREMLDHTNAVGRRMSALFGPLQIEKRKPCNQSEFTVSRETGSKDPTMRAAGVNEAAEGADIHRIWADDIVDSMERFEDSTRDMTYYKFMGTWMRRLRGDQTFTVVIGHQFHHDDTYSRIIKNNRMKDDGQPEWKIVRMFVGMGDDRHYPLWDKYGRTRLAAEDRKDRGLYDAQFLGNPKPESSRIIRKLTYMRHEPGRFEDDRKFVASSQLILSLDPTATVGKGSDKAGVVLFAFNQLVPELRILDMWELPFNQHELAAFVANLCQSMAIQEIYIETVTGFHATADELVYNYGIPESSIVRRRQDGVSKKETRLRASAAHFENGRVTFRGVWNDEKKKVEPDPQKQWAYEQILDFGAVQGDHIVDAITQVVISKAVYLAENGEGTANVRLGQPVQMTPERRRMMSFVKQLISVNQQEKPGDRANEEMEYVVDHAVNVDGYDLMFGEQESLSWN